MSAIASQITSRTIVYSDVYSRRRSKKHQSSESLAFVWGIHQWPVHSPHKGPITHKMFLCDDVIMRPCDCLFHRLFKAKVKENIKAPRHWHLCGELTGEILPQRASNAENISIWWRRHNKFCWIALVLWALRSPNLIIDHWMSAHIFIVMNCGWEFS